MNVYEKKPCFSPDSKVCGGEHQLHVYKAPRNVSVINK